MASPGAPMMLRRRILQNVLAIFMPPTAARADYELQRFTED